MLDSEYILAKENYNLSKGINNSIEKSNNYSKNSKNNNSLFLSSITNFDLSSQNDSFDLCDELNVDFSFIIKSPPSPIFFKKNCGDIILKKENKIFENNTIAKKKLNKSLKEEKNKIFDIKKIVKLGRCKKLSVKKGKHDKFQKDNLIRKFKVHLSKNIYNFVNSCFLINNKIKPENHINVIKKLSSFNIKSIKKEENLRWLDTKLNLYFSQEISKKFCHCEGNYNKMLIKRIYEKKEEKKVISLLDMSIRDMWNIYLNGTNDEKYIGFKTLEDDLNIFKNKGESEEYIQEYKNICFQFENIFNNMISKKKKY